jgi:hypothetical protein
MNRKALTFLFALVVASVAAVAAAFGGGGGNDLAAARAGTAKYHVLALAKKDGYGLLKDAAGIACIDMPGMGAMGIHYANNDLVGDNGGPATVTPATPEAVIYEPQRNGRLRLVAVEYVVLKSAWDATHASPPRLFGHEFNFTPAGNRFGLPPFYSLHAWIWKHNPAGTFEMFNPNVSCENA